MDDGKGVNFKQIYEGYLNYFVTNATLVPGTEYSFKVKATNINGEGTISSEVKLKSCVAPFGVKPP